MSDDVAATETQRPVRGTRFMIGCDWSGAPHLSPDAQEQLWASIPQYQRDARSKGIPQLGSGAIYPFAETEIRCADIPIPNHWPRAFGMDTALSGVTAAAWGAVDRESGVLYIYSVYRRAQAETAVHAEAIKSRGAWIPGAADAADVLDHDRTRFIDLYRRHGLDISLPDKAVETGIQAVYDRMSAGKFKVFASCAAFFEEFRIYQRNDQGKVVKRSDHVLDACRYLVSSSLRRAKVPPKPVDPEEDLMRKRNLRPGSWMS